MHEFEQLEDAVIAALAPLKTEGLNDPDVYVGQFEVEDFKSMLPLFPCIYVIAGEMNVPESDTNRIKLGVLLLTGDQNRRSARAVVRGDATKQGVYHWLDRSHDLLHQKKLVPNWRSLRLSYERPLIYLPKEKICLFESLYTTEI